MRSVLLLMLFSFTLQGQDQQVLYLPDSVPLVFTKIPAGDFTMGSPLSEPGRDKDEAPQQEVQVASFWLGTHEVTQAQWLSVMGYNPSVFKDPLNAVEMVSWNDCQVFLDILNEKWEGRGFFDCQRKQSGNMLAGWGRQSIKMSKVKLYPGKRKIYRGGSWFNEPEALRPENRHGHEPNQVFTNAGLRLVYVLE